MRNEPKRYQSINLKYFLPYRSQSSFERSSRRLLIVIVGVRCDEFFSIVQLVASLLKKSRA